MPVKGFTGQQTRGWAAKLGMDLEEDFHKPEDTLGLGTGEVIEGVEEAAFQRSDVIEAAKQSVNFLGALAMPTIFKYDFPPVLQAAWQLLTDGAAANKQLFPQIALGIPRGHAKTTLIKLFILYCILFTQKKFILILCDTAKNAENIVADIADMLNEPNIKNMFGDWNMGLEINRQDLKKFAFRGRGISIGALGAGGSIRGLNIKHTRPDVMVFEDIQTKECSESQVQSQSLERWMIGTAMKAKSPGGCTFIFVGNMYPGPNAILKKLKNNPAWVKFISGAILADGTALWPDLRSLASLIAELDNDMAMGHPEIFFSEVLNDTEAGINNRVDFSSLKPWSFTPLDRPQGKFLIIDPSADKAKGDEVTIAYFEVYDGVPCLRKLIEDKLSPGNTIRSALLLAIEHGVRVIAVESTSYQYTLLYWFGEVTRSLGITGIQAVDVYTGSTSKNARISSMLKSLTSGEIILHDEVKHAVTHQIANWNPIKRDNVDGILDTLTYAPKVLEMYGVEITTDDNFMLLETAGEQVQEYNSSF